MRHLSSIVMLALAWMLSCQKQPQAVLSEDTRGLMARIDIKPLSANCTPKAQLWQKVSENEQLRLKLQGPCRYELRVDIGRSEEKNLTEILYSSAHPQKPKANIFIQNSSETAEITVYPVRSKTPPFQAFRPSFADTTPTTYDAVSPTERGPSFYAKLKPALDRSCVSCHEPAGVASSLRLDTYPFVGVFLRDEKQIVSAILDHVLASDMPPPGSKPPLEASEIAILKEWQP